MAGTTVLLNRLIIAAAFVTLACSAAAVMPSDAWLVDLLSNLRLPLTTAALLLAVLASIRRLWRTAGIALCAAIPGLALIATAVTAEPTDSETESGLTVVSYNLNLTNRNHADTLSLLLSSGSDIILLQEYTPAWDQSLAELRQSYPHHVTYPLAGSFGIALFSRHSLRESRLVDLPHGVPAILGRIELHGRPLTILNVHVEWPLFPSAQKRRNQQLAALAQLIREDNGMQLVCGDFNMTATSRGAKTFLADAGLATLGGREALLGTWPARLPGLRIAIDHCFAPDATTLRRKRLLKATGSDHLPIVFDIVMHAAP